jgi:hypothetical protein
MHSPEEHSNTVISPLDDVQERVRQFNDYEAVWRCFAKKRTHRKQLLKLLAILSAPSQLTEGDLDWLDWLAAEREARPVRTIGTWIAP